MIRSLPTPVCIKARNLLVMMRPIVMLPEPMHTDQEMTSKQYNQRSALLVGISRRL